jgi:signal peptidase I
MSQTNRYLCCLGILGLMSLLLPLRMLQISGNSMEPTLHHGQRYLLDRFYYRLGGLEYGDIVVAQHGPEEIVKRVKGLPGDLLQADELPGGMLVNLVNVTRQPGVRRRSKRLRLWEQPVPEGTVFLVGDNLIVSDDSRRFGPVFIRDVAGVVRRLDLSRYFPEPVGRPLPPPIRQVVMPPSPDRGTVGQPGVRD